MRKICLRGDSLTLGDNAAGFRPITYELLRRHADPFEFVGSQTYPISDTSFRWRLGFPYHEGYSGYRVEQIQALIATTIAVSAPDLIFNLYGINNIGQDESAVTIANRIVADIAAVRAALPHVVFVGSTIQPWNYYLDDAPTKAAREAVRVALNAALPAVFAAADAAAQGGSATGRAVLVDSGLTTSDQIFDGIHLNTAGNTKVANAWNAAYAALYPTKTTTPWPRRRLARGISSAIQITASSQYVSLPQNAVYAVGEESFALLLEFTPMTRATGANCICQIPAIDYHGGLFLNQNGEDLGLYVDSAGPPTFTAYRVLQPFRPIRLALVGDAERGELRLLADGQQVPYASNKGQAWDLSGSTFDGVNGAVRLGRSVDISSAALGRYSDFIFIRGRAPTLYELEREFFEGHAPDGIVSRYRLSEGAGTAVQPDAGLGLSAGSLVGGPAWTTVTRHRERSLGA